MYSNSNWIDCGGRTALVPSNEPLDDLCGDDQDDDQPIAELTDELVFVEF